MAKQSDFNSFLKDIEPSTTTVSYISSIQTNLRDYLKSHESYKFVHTDTFLSGSYAKHTSIRPVAGDKKRDVDIIVVTTYSSDKYFQFGIYAFNQPKRTTNVPVGNAIIPHSNFIKAFVK